MSDDQPDTGNNRQHEYDGADAQKGEHLPISSTSRSPEYSASADDRSESRKGNTADHSNDAMLGLQRRITAFTFLSLVVSTVAMLFVGVQSYEAVTGAATAQNAANSAASFASAAQSEAAAANTSAQAAVSQTKIANAQVGLAQDALNISRQNLKVGGEQAKALASSAAALGISANAQDRAAARQLQSVQLLIQDIPTPPFTTGSTFQGHWVFNNGSPGAVIIHRTLSRFFYTPGDPLPSMGGIQELLRQQLDNPGTIRPGLSSTFTFPGERIPLSQNQIDSLNNNTVEISFLVGVEWEDADHIVHHAYACSVNKKVDSTWSRQECRRPLDD